MILIAHGGNTLGRKKELENKTENITETLKKGMVFVIVFWSINKQFYLGHDKPQYKM